MFLQNVRVEGLRNLKVTNFSLSERLTVFCGANGAGKSSVLEAISLLTSGRSFRTNKLGLIVANNEAQFTVFGAFQPNLKLGLNHNKSAKSNRIKINGEAVASLSLLAKHYPTQVLCPESYHLVDAGPSERRKFLDWLLFHVEHQYLDGWKAYSKLIKQRNAYLRLKGKRFDKYELQVWDKQIVDKANFIDKVRAKQMLAIDESLKRILEKLECDFVKDITLGYYAGYRGELEERLADSILSDAERGYTQYGPHKADIRIKVAGQLAKDVLSRGQKKVLINALFLAQTSVLKKETNKDSLFIIDDFSSELDEANQKALIGILMAQKNTQIVLSCLHLDALKGLEKGYNSAHMFHVEHGVISPMGKTANVE